MNDNANAAAEPTLDPTVSDRAGAPAPAPPRRAIPAKPHARDVTLPPGFRLHEYRIDAILGQGGFGIAYAATDVNLNTRVVVKEYLPEEFAYRAVDGTVRVREGAAAWETVRSSSTASSSRLTCGSVPTVRWSPTSPPIGREAPRYHTPSAGPGNARDDRDLHR